jgi:hypothetical protein
MPQRKWGVKQFLFIFFMQRARIPSEMQDIQMGFLMSERKPPFLKTFFEKEPRKERGRGGRCREKL